MILFFIVNLLVFYFQTVRDNKFHICYFFLVILCVCITLQIFKSKFLQKFLYIMCCTK